MVDFRFYLNRSGLRGAKGEKGDTGFSPTIVEGTNNVNTYTLKIKNEFDEFETPNLRGDSIDISDPRGTYIRYNQLTGKSYVGSVDRASVDTYGMVRIADEYDFEDFSNEAVVTPASFADNIKGMFTSPDGSVIITQSPDNSKTELRVDKTTEQGLTVRVSNLEGDVVFLESELNTTKADLTTETRNRTNADTNLQNQINNRLTSNNIKQGSNITITRSGNDITINAEETLKINDNIPSTTSVYSSSKTSNLVGELGNEVNSIAGRLNNLEDTVVVATGNKLGLVKPDNTTIVIDENGTLTAIGGGGGGGGGGVTPQYVTAAINTHNTDTESHEDIREALKQVQLFKFPNATIVGEPSISHGQVSGFTANDYMQFPFVLDLHNRRFQIDFEFTTDSDVTTQQNILDSQFGIALAIKDGKGLMAISSNGTSWDIGSSVGNIDILPNHTYQARLTWNGILYRTAISTNGKDYNIDMQLTSNLSPYPRVIFIGGCPGGAIGHTPHPFFGSINMNKASMLINDEHFWEGMDDAGLATRLDVDLANITEVGKDAIGKIVDEKLGFISDALDTINGEVI